MGECPGIVDGFDRYIPPSLQAKREVLLTAAGIVLRYSSDHEGMMLARASSPFCLCDFRVSFSQKSNSSENGERNMNM